MADIRSMLARNDRSFSMCAALYLAIFFFFLPLQIQAEPAFQFHTLDKQQGLASSVVYDIAEDKDGFIWFATEDGLQKYDGVKFTNYRHSRSDQRSLSSNIIRSLLVDSSDRLWIGTDNGLDLYRKEYDDFVRFDENTLASGNQLLSNRIRALYQTGDGMIWIGTTKGLSSFETQSLAVQNFEHAKVRTIYEDDHKQLWIGTLGSGLFLFNRSTSFFKSVYKVYGPKKERSLDRLSKSSIVDIFNDTYGRIFISTWGKGIYQLNRDNHKLFKYSIPLPSQYVKTIYQDESDRIWFGTQNGILIEDTVNKKWRVVGTDQDNTGSSSINNIFKIFQSSDKTVWVGTHGKGVSRHFPSSRKFASFGKSKEEKFGLSDTVVFSLSEGINRSIWVGTEQGEISKFDPDTNTFEHFDVLLNGIKFKGAISGIYQIDSKSLLVGTELGLFRYWMKKKKLEVFKNSFGEPFRDGEPVRQVKTDEYGRIWVIFFRSGIQALKNDGNGKLLIVENLNLDIKASQTILNVTKNHLIVGTEGLGIVDVTLSQTIQIGLKPFSQNTNVLDMTLDKQSKLWVATASEGIKVFDKDKKPFVLSEDDGLPNNTVYSIIHDHASDRIWATTNEGMVSINPHTFQILHYGFYDGLQGDEFNRAGLKSKSGYIYFGGMNGFNRFFPNIIKNNLYLNEPKITVLSIANKEIKVSKEKNSVLSRSLLVADKIDLQYDQTPFTLEFSSPQFVKPSNLEFRYRLVGLNESWISAAKESRRATYTNIDAGEYVFELQVRDVNSNWQGNMVKKRIVIHPPIWLTNWAKIFYVVLFISLIATFSYLNWKRRQAELSVQKTIEESEKRLRLSLWGGGNEIWDWNILSGEVLRSDADKNININCGRLSKNLKELSSYIHKYDLERVKRELNAHLSGKTEFFDSAYRIKDNKLGWRWIQDRAKVVEKDFDNHPIRMSGTQKDVSEIHRKDEEIERLGQAFRTTSDGVWIRDSKWCLIECNPSYEKMTGFSFTEKKGEELWFPNVAEQSVNIIQRIRLSILEKGNWQGEVWAERKEQDPFPQKLTIDTILDEKGNVRYYVGVFSDITFHKRAEEEFRKLANFDSLTGLPNRACLYDRLNQTIDKTRIRKERFAIFVIDIDNFKRVNDSLGHSVGDTLISQVAQRLTNCSKDGDTVARVGGDEFVIIRDDIQSSTEVASFAELILKELNLPVYIKGQKLNSNFSIGITISPEDGITAEKLLRNADTAMYEAKKDVLSSYHFYSVELNQKARKRLAMENELRTAVKQGSIDLVYQPKVDMKTGRVCGMEALARWNHPKFGRVSPEDFISLAEEIGLIQPLGHQLLKKAVAQTKEWVDKKIMRGRMSVNLSAHQFWHQDLVGDIKFILESSQLDPKYLELELTESACVQDVEQTIEQMLGIRKLGIHLALDDFGTGYSSLAQLKILPLDTLKVDKSFINNIHKSKRDGNIVKAIIEVANGLDLNVVIEGVETQEQCDYLWQCRASVIQGYFFSKPVDQSTMYELLEKKWEKQNYLSKTALNVTSLG